MSRVRRWWRGSEDHGVAERGGRGSGRKWIGMQGERVSRSRGSGRLGRGLWGKDEVEVGEGGGAGGRGVGGRMGEQEVENGEGMRQSRGAGKLDEGRGSKRRE